jgi:hypothetical protein
MTPLGTVGLAHDARVRHSDVHSLEFNGALR